MAVLANGKLGVSLDNKLNHFQSLPVN